LTGELRVTARRRITYWMRSGFGMGPSRSAFFLYLGRLYAPNSTLPLWKLGDHLFMVLGVLRCLYCLLYGVRSTGRLP